MHGGAPIAVGGVGGSGTRVVATILEEAGIWMGGDLNEAHDNLWFTLLFKHSAIIDASETSFREMVSLFVAAMTGEVAAIPFSDALLDELVNNGRPQHDAVWLQARAESLKQALAAPRRVSAWGWKEPNTHIVAHRLPAHIPDVRFIHVARNGLDMAYSSNQNQLSLWGPAVLDGDHAVNPRNSLRFWRWAHARILAIGAGMGERFLFVRFEDLCRNPEMEVPRILAFAGAPSDSATLERAIRLVEPPASIGRYSARSLDDFDPDDVAFVRSLGFAA